jgi:phosphoglycerol transferase MdoB-like AlkP superfamily enzyme
MYQPPRLVRWIAIIVGFFFLLLTIFRFIFYWRYMQAGGFPQDAFLMGMRVDVRSVSILGLFILLLCAIPLIHPFKNGRAKKFWNFFLPFVFFLVLFFYAIDYFHYDYLHQRLNGSVLNYLEDANISMNMVWQTYPVIRSLLIIIVLLAVAVFLFSRVLVSFQKDKPVTYKRSWLWVLGFTLLLMWGTWGSMGQFPLRWSNVYSLGDAYKAQLALNPFQSFASTLKFRSSTYDIKKTKEYYPLMADYLGIQNPNAEQLNFERIYDSVNKLPFKPNIVLVICESFSAYKSSMYGNPLNTTPFFDSLSKQGVFFDRCFTPTYGTARGVWATITGIPDVETPKTASRNPNMVDQHTIINDFVGYDKFYFIGGNANWANIRGLLKNNISDLQLYEQEDYQGAKVDVWGISDKNLFIESSKILAKQTKPFFAVIQTADNHRPYTIPDEDLKEFKKIELPVDTLKKYGFVSNDEFNAFRYTDFSYRKFIETAKQFPYFKNTLFVFVGDHGIRGDAGNMFPRVWTEEALTTVHVPLLFYFPSLLQPKRESNACSQIDVLPSIAGAVGQAFKNTTIGRNLFDTSLQKNRLRYSSAFIIDPDEKKMGVVTDEYYFRKKNGQTTGRLTPMHNNESPVATTSKDSILRKLNGLSNAIFETSRYMLYNNKKK